jgi:hypothetical protein
MGHISASEYVYDRCCGVFEFPRLIGRNAIAALKSRGFESCTHSVSDRVKRDTPKAVPSSSVRSVRSVRSGRAVQAVRPVRSVRSVRSAQFDISDLSSFQRVKGDPQKRHQICEGAGLK